MQVEQEPFIPTDFPEDGIYEPDLEKFVCYCPDKEFTTQAQLVETREGTYVCPDCGWVCPGTTVFNNGPEPQYREDYTNFGGTQYSYKRPRGNKDFGITAACTTTAAQLSGNAGRYKPLFHFNERVAQLVLSDPPIPEDIMDRIRKEAETGDYGPIEFLTRSDVFLIIRKLDKLYPQGIVDTHWKRNLEQKINRYTMAEVDKRAEYHQS